MSQHTDRSELDITYAVVGGTELRLDIHRASAPDAPVVVYAHGGGWARGSRTDRAGTRLAGLAEHGVTVVSVDYRLVPEAHFPEPVHDVKAAIRWLRAHGEQLGLPTDRLGGWGASAGAYLVSLVALSPDDPALEGDVGGNQDHSSSLQAVVHWFGQTDLARAAARSELEARILPFHYESDFLGVGPGDDVGGDGVGRSTELSLLRRVTRTAPPFLFAHGDSDRVIPASESFALHDALARAGASSRIELLGGAGHEDAAFDAPASLATTAAWLRAVLQPQ
ncbi:hypothetical protein GCM10022286_24980 [Gryllotalpicola daejeonensis]|uniref:BD-FAE-like domain-containing protein n=1 Tax=Gryllotalpicola daejeonensis TaxID=993087 RepID=A0ABP7ZM51_9MICO